MDRFVRTFKRRKTFLDSLSVGDSVSRAARLAGGTPSNFKSWRNSDPDFAADWDEALDEGTDFIEDVATERALTKSDPLMAMILKARRPDKYDRGGKLELSGGISVEGSRSKLLNKIARLQASGPLSSALSEGSPALLEEAAETPSLPAPDSAAGGGVVRGSKRRASAQRG